MGAVEAEAKDRRAAEDLAGGMRAETSDRFEADPEKPAGMGQFIHRRGVFHWLLNLIIY